MNFRETQYGFEWGSVKIDRHCSDDKKGWVVFGIETPKYKDHNALQVYITKTGKIRISGPTGEWRRP